MNDPQIRQAFHNTFLQKQHNESTTLILDELGLEHGKCRADIAVINGHMDGFEIKSDVDSLSRLSHQINSYDSIFDYSSVVVTARHLNEVVRTIPDWWGIISVMESNSDVPQFMVIKTPHQNANIDDYLVAQLLWREEAQKVLFNLGMRGAQLRQKRSILYGYIVEMLDSHELRHTVREHLKKRQNWRRPGPLLPNDG
jgi:ribosomal protein L39E